MDGSLRVPSMFNTPRAVASDRAGTLGRGLKLLFATAACLTLAVAALIAASPLAPGSVDRGRTDWDAHRQVCRGLPEELYHRDRFRAIKGRVTDEDGKPVVGASVRCAGLESLSRLAGAGKPSSSIWSIPIEAEVRTGDDGSYDFPHLPVGARTFFYSAPGRDLSPAIKDLIVVQDGLGARLDVTLGPPATLRVKLASPAEAARRLVLVPHRWWPSVIETSVAKGATSAEFRGLGGPFRRGLIVEAGPDGGSPWRLAGGYDLGLSSEAELPGPGGPELRAVLPEAAGLEPWAGLSAPACRRFFAAMSPVALFWPEAPDDGPFLSAQEEFLAAASARARSGSARGFAPHPFLPVLVESRAGGAWMAWTSEASELEVAGPSRPGSTACGPSTSWATSRSPAASRSGRGRPRSSKHRSPTSSTRRRRRAGKSWGSSAGRAAPRPRRPRSSCNTRGISAGSSAGPRRTIRGCLFHFPDVPGNEPYFLFATPAGLDDSVREFETFRVSSGASEVWRELTVHPHRLAGEHPSLASLPLQLIRVEAAGERLLWSLMMMMMNAGPMGRGGSRFRTSPTAAMSSELPRADRPGVPCPSTSPTANPISMSGGPVRRPREPRAVSGAPSVITSLPVRPRSEFAERRS